MRFRALQRCSLPGIALAVAVASLPPQALAQDLPEIAIFSEEEEGILSEEELEAYEATTTADLEIPLDELELLLMPLTQGELEVEAAAWLRLVKEEVHKLAAAEIAAKYKRLEIAQAEAAAAAATEAAEAAESAEKEQEAGAPDDGEAAAAEAEEAAADAAEEAQAAVAALEEIKEKAQQHEGTQEAIEEATAEAGSEGADDDHGHLEAAAAQAAGEADTETLEQVAEAFEDAAAANVEVREEIFDRLATIRETRTRLVDRAALVLDELEEKGGEVDERRAYLSAVSGIVIDVTDTTAATATLMAWAKSPEGGMRWLKNFAAFVGVILAALLAAWLVSRLVDRVIRMSDHISELTRVFMVRTLRWLIVISGFLVGLSMLEINVGPMLAVIGAAGFVIAFALQDSLGNVASGLMVMIFRPFDVGDVVELADVHGTIDSMNLVSTTLKTPDNRVVVVPNNEVWGGVITNLTRSQRRRVDLTYTVSRDADVAKVQAALERLVAQHPLVLEDPEPVVEVQEMDDSTVTFLCRPWTKTADRRKVRWDLNRSVALRFEDAAVGDPPASSA